MLSPRKASGTSFLSKDVGVVWEFVSRPLHLQQEIVDCSRFENSKKIVKEIYSEADRKIFDHVSVFNPDYLEIVWKLVVDIVLFIVNFVLQEYICSISYW